jgi:hypothetical protein
MDDSSYVVKRPPRADAEFYVGLSVCISAVDEDVLSIELERASP